jgi:predicted O-methyltransferase YrrM
MHSLAYFLQEQTEVDPKNLFQQLSALMNLYRDLGLQKSLPRTRGFAASPDFLDELVECSFNAKPNVVVECGSGVSTIVLARCLQLNRSGHLYSLEHLPEYAEETRRNLAKHSLSEWATVLDAPLHPHSIGSDNWLWYSEDNLPELQIDMLVIDGPPQATGRMARYPAGPMLFRRLAHDAAVFCDDTVRADEKAMLQRWLKEFPELRQKDKYCEKGCVVLSKKV